MRTLSIVFYRCKSGHALFIQVNDKWIVRSHCNVQSDSGFDFVLILSNIFQQKPILISNLKPSTRSGFPRYLHTMVESSRGTCDVINGQKALKYLIGIINKVNAPSPTRSDGFYDPGSLVTLRGLTEVLILAGHHVGLGHKVK